MASAYLTLKQKHQKEVNEFPMVFAFSKDQFVEAMKTLGLTPEDTDKVYSIGGGCFIRKTDSKALHEMLDRHQKEMNEAIESDITGEGFIYQMFLYELENHEYGYTMDIEPTLEALGLSYNEVKASKTLSYGLEKAMKIAAGEDE